MIKIINCKLNQAKFDDLNQRALDWYLDNIEDADMDEWCNPLIHPVSGDIGWTYEDRISEALTEQELTEVETAGNDWFPPFP